MSERNRSPVLVALAALLISVVSADEYRDFKKQCYPCVAFGYNYCKDDPNLVNLNADKCYTLGSDKQDYCRDFTFIDNRMLCEELEDQQISESRACDMFLPENMKYYEVQNVQLTLEPRSACGFYLYQYAAHLNITQQWPVTLYHNEYTKVKYTETERMVKTGNFTTESGETIEVSCLDQPCNNYYWVTYGLHYFLLVNWDYDEAQTIELEVFDLGAGWITKSLPLALSAVALAVSLVI